MLAFVTFEKTVVEKLCLFRVIQTSKKLVVEVDFDISNFMIDFSYDSSKLKMLVHDMLVKTCNEIVSQNQLTQSKKSIMVTI